MYDASGQRVNEALEYGAPINPTTIRQHSEDELPIIEPGVNTISPAVETKAAERAIGRERTGQIQPGTSASVTADTNDDDVKTPEALGNTRDAERRRG